VLQRVLLAGSPQDSVRLLQQVQQEGAGAGGGAAAQGSSQAHA
jgi:hypothetical protein